MPTKKNVKVTAETEATRLNEEGKSLGFIRSFLLVNELVKTSGEALKLTKDLGLTSKKVNFAATYYAYLSEAERTKEEATDYITNPANSKNVVAHLSHYIGIWELSVAIWKSKT